MSQATAERIVEIIGIYILLGVFYSFYFYRVQAPSLDPVFARAKWNVKFLMLPATVMLWPLVALFGRKNA